MMKANDAGIVREEIGRYLIEASAWRPSDKDKWRARLTITRKCDGPGAPLSQTFRDISTVFEDAGDACRCAYERGKKLINEGPPNLKI
jgi:hypothetical protein